MNNGANKCGDRVGDAVALGRQLTVEFYDCSSAILADAVKLKAVFLEAARVSGAHVVDALFHTFEPQGVSGVVVISESHFAVHAWPEHDYAAVDLFTCGAGVDFDRAVASIGAGLHSGRWLVSSLVNRGILGESGVERLVPVVENEKSRGLQLSWRERFQRSNARAMSSCIDIYGCNPLKLSSEATLREFSDQLARLLGGEGDASGEWGFSVKEDGEAEFARAFGRGHLNGFVHRTGETVYLDIFTDGFFDPREAAEFAMRHLEGGYYRMQPQVRQ